MVSTYVSILKLVAMAAITDTGTVNHDVFESEDPLTDFDSEQDDYW